MADQRRTTGRLLALVVPLALLAPGAAHAEKVVVDDAAGDAQLVTSYVPAGGPLVVTTEPAPDETAVDITRTVVAHGDTRLSVRIGFRDLVLSSVHETYVRVVTPRGGYAVLVGKTPGLRAHSVLLRRGLESECRGLRARVDGAADEVALSLPTACIGSPRWVRAGVGVTRVAVDAAAFAQPNGIAQLADDGNRDGVRENSLGLGPKVRRG